MNHNLETVPRLYAVARRSAVTTRTRSGYCGNFRELVPSVPTKGAG